MRISTLHMMTPTTRPKHNHKKNDRVQEDVDAPSITTFSEQQQQQPLEGKMEATGYYCRQPSFSHDAPSNTAAASSSPSQQQHQQLSLRQQLLLPQHSSAKLFVLAAAFAASVCCQLVPTATSTTFLSLISFVDGSIDAELPPATTTSKLSGNNNYHLQRQEDTPLQSNSIGNNSNNNPLVRPVVSADTTGSINSAAGDEQDQYKKEENNQKQQKQQKEYTQQQQQQIPPIGGFGEYNWLPTQYSLSHARFDGSITLYNSQFLLVGGCLDFNCQTESSFMDLINPLPPGNVSDMGELPIMLEVSLGDLKKKNAAAAAPVATLGYDDELRAAPPLPSSAKRQQQQLKKVAARLVREEKEEALQQQQQQQQHREELVRDANTVADILRRQLLVSGQYSTQIVSNYNLTDKGITFGNVIWVAGPCSAFYPANFPAASTAPFNSDGNSNGASPLNGGNDVTPEEIEQAFLIAKHRGLWALSEDLQTVNRTYTISTDFTLRANASCVSYLNRIFIVGGANIDDRPGFRCRRGSLSLKDRMKKFGASYGENKLSRSQQPSFIVGRDPVAAYSGEEANLVINTYEYDEDSKLLLDGRLVRSNKEVTLGRCPGFDSAADDAVGDSSPILFDTIDVFDVRTGKYEPDLVSFEVPRMNAAVNVDNAILYIAGGQMSVASAPSPDAVPGAPINYTSAACPNVQGLLFSLLFLYNESMPFTPVPLPKNPLLEIINGLHFNGGLSPEQVELLATEEASQDAELVRIKDLYKAYTSADLNIWSISKVFSYTGEIIMTTGMSAFAFLPCYPINTTVAPNPTIADLNTESLEQHFDRKVSINTNNDDDGGVRSSSSERERVDRMTDLKKRLSDVRARFGYLMPTTTPAAAIAPQSSTDVLPGGPSPNLPTNVGTSSCVNASGVPTTWSYTYTFTTVRRSSILEIPMAIFASRIFLTLIALGGEVLTVGDDSGSLGAASPISSSQIHLRNPLLNNNKALINNNNDRLGGSGRISIVSGVVSAPVLPFPTSPSLDSDNPIPMINQLSTAVASLTPFHTEPYYLIGENVTIQFFEWTQPAFVRFSPNSACYTNAGGVVDIYIPAPTSFPTNPSISFTPLFESFAVYMCVSLGATNISYFDIPFNEREEQERAQSVMMGRREGEGRGMMSSENVNSSSSYTESIPIKVVLYGCINPLQPFKFLREPPPAPTTSPTTPPPRNDDPPSSGFSAWIANSTHAIAFSLIMVTLVGVAGMLGFFVIRSKRKQEEAAAKRKSRQAKNNINSNDSDDESVSGGGGRGKNALYSVNATDVSGRFALDNDDAVVRNTTLDSRYRIKKRIGQGSFSSVYLVKRKSDSTEFAMKYLICGNDRDRLEAIKECETINSIQGHPNIIALYDMFMNYEFNPTPSPSSLDGSVNGGAGGGGGLGVPITFNNNQQQQQQQQQHVGTPQFIRNNIAQTRLLEGANKNNGYGATTGGVSPPLAAVPSPPPPPAHLSTPSSPLKAKANVHTRYLCLVMEYHKSGDLCHYILKNSATSHELFRQAFREYQHQQQILQESANNHNSNGGGFYNNQRNSFESSSSYYTQNSNNSTTAVPSGIDFDGGAGTGSFGMSCTPPVTSINHSLTNSPASPMLITGSSTRQAAPPRYQPLGESALLSVTMQLCSALHHLHSCRPAPIVHRDLKPENVLIRGALPNRHDTYIPVLITDFGLAFLQEENRRSGRGGGTRPYISPESWKGQTTIASDMWSLGCVLYALATERLTADTVRVMFEDVKRPKFQEEIMYDLVEDHGYSLEFAQLVVSLLEVDPRKRPTAGSLLMRFVEVDPAHNKLSSGPSGSMRSDGHEENGRTATPQNDRGGSESSRTGSISRSSSNFSAANNDDDNSLSFAGSESSSCYNHPDPQRRKFVVLLPPPPLSNSSNRNSIGSGRGGVNGDQPSTTRTSGASHGTAGGRRSPAVVHRARSSGGNSASSRAGGGGIVRRSSRNKEGVTSRRRKGSASTGGSGATKQPEVSVVSPPEGRTKLPSPPRREE